MSDPNACPSCRGGLGITGKNCRVCGGTTKLNFDQQNPAHLLRRIESLEERLVAMEKRMRLIGGA